MKKGDYVIIYNLKKKINFNDKIAIITNNKLEENKISIKTYDYFNSPNKFININISKKNLKKIENDNMTNYNWNSKVLNSKYYNL